jgi:hypothetical protein
LILVAAPGFESGPFQWKALIFNQLRSGSFLSITRNKTLLFFAPRTRRLAKKAKEAVEVLREELGDLGRRMQSLR